MKLQQPHSTTVDLSGQESPWLTMVHAASHDQRFFASQVETFQEDFRLLLIDLPGHGRSGTLAGPFGLEEYAESVLAAMDANGVEKSHYLGTHTGAGVGLMLATRYGHRFQSLALESTPVPGIDIPSVNTALNRARDTARDNGIEAARIAWFQHEPWFDIIRQNPERCRADAHWAMIAEFSGQPWLDSKPPRPVAPILEQLSSIDCPVLVINGEYDVADFLRAADEMERRLPHMTRVRIPDAGGFPMWERPEQTNEYIRRHLQAAVMKASD
ncbi:MAG: alpha/beta fold hydrolase [Gammaproteobacteria bacterium]|nr:alpha/beta fold hydrolase [Gammaproteobacteria bacterium]MDX2461268.1 alpha/beta fold hydrolase [Gammaproteobacteria bacterium]